MAKKKKPARKGPKPLAKPKAEKAVKPTRIRVYLAVGSGGDWEVFGSRQDAKDRAASWNKEGDNAAVHEVVFAVPFPRSPRRPKWEAGLRLGAQVKKVSEHAVPDNDETQRPLFNPFAGGAPFPTDAEIAAQAAAGMPSEFTLGMVTAQARAEANKAAP